MCIKPSATAEVIASSRHHQNKGSITKETTGTGDRFSALTHLGGGDYDIIINVPWSVDLGHRTSCTCPSSRSKPSGKRIPMPNPGFSMKNIAVATSE